ncbi:mRNA interferase PemK [compost metagenome]
MAIRGTVKRGSIVIMDLDPQAGHEQAGTRPAIVLSDGLIDPVVSSFALVVPVTNQVKGLSFEVPVPEGIRTTGKQPYLEGVVLTDQPKSLDLDIRRAKVVGQIDITSEFFRTVITNVRSILA